MFVKPEHHQKQPEPKEVSEEGSEMLFNLIQFIKQFSLKDVMEDGIVMVVNPQHEEKQPLPKEVTEEGIVMLFNSRQLSNALSPNAVTGYSTPSLAFTFSGTTISPEYFSPTFAVSVAVLASESIR